jgi:hypothetical protein
VDLPLQGCAVAAAVAYLLLPFYLAGSESPYDGVARVVECHRRPSVLWLYHQCRLAPPCEGHGSPLGVYEDPATSMRPLHGIAEFQMHGSRVRGSGNLTMLVAKGTPALPFWSPILFLPVFFGATLLVGTIQVRPANRLAEALRR